MYQGHECLGGHKKILYNAQSSKRYVFAMLKRGNLKKWYWRALAFDEGFLQSFPVFRRSTGSD